MKTVGVLVIVIGAVLAAGGLRGRPQPEAVALATGSAAALAGIDVYYAARGRISPVYLLDALAEVVFAALIVRRGVSSRRPPFPGSYR